MMAYIKLARVFCWVFALLTVVKTQSCPFDGFESHKLEVYETYGHSLINGSTPGLFLNQSKYGVEGGQVVFVNDTFYLFITEFTGDPRWVPSNLAIWSCPMSDFPYGWVRQRTLFQSGGVCDCDPTNNRASLGSSITIHYDNVNNVWLTYYVGFQCCNSDAYFYNRYGQIYVAQSTSPGVDGINAPYEDITVVLKMDNNSQPWEGLQGDDSFSNLMEINDTFYAFYGSALTQDTPCCAQAVGLIQSQNLYKNWTRMPYGTENPVTLISISDVEQPIPIQFADGSFGAVFDALNWEGAGDVGYAWSPDGTSWDENCYQLLTVNDPQNPSHWGTARTPQGLIPINETHFYLFFSGYDNIGAPNHESFGYARVRFVQ